MSDLKLNQKLEDINESKQAIKQALINKRSKPNRCTINLCRFN